MKRIGSEFLERVRTQRSHHSVAQCELCAATHHDGKKNADHNDEGNREEDSPKNDHRGPPKNFSHGFLLHLEGTVRKGCCNLSLTLLVNRRQIQRRTNGIIQLLPGVQEGHEEGSCSSRFLRRRFRRNLWQLWICRTTALWWGWLSDLLRNTAT